MLVFYYDNLHLDQNLGNRNSIKGHAQETEDSPQKIPFIHLEKGRYIMNMPNWIQWFELGDGFTSLVVL